MSSPERQLRRRRFYQFSLRTLLVVVTLAAGCAAAWRFCVEPYRLERDAMAAIAKLGGTYKAEDATGWIRYFDKNPQNVVTVDLADCDQPADYLPHLARLPKLKTLVVGGHEFGDEQLNALRRIRSLRALVLDSTKVSDEAVERIKQELPGAAVYTSERRATAALKKLNVGVADYDLIESVGRRYPRIALQANRPQPLCNEIGDGYFVEPATCAWLFRTAPRDDELAWFTNLANLRVIYLTETQLRGDCLAYVTSPMVKKLSIVGTGGTNFSLAHVGRFTNLLELQVRKVHIPEEDMLQLAALKHLVYLILSHTNLTDNGLKHVADLTSIKSISLSQTELTDRGAKHLAGLTSIESIDINDTAITDLGLKHLAGLTSLGGFAASNTHTGDAGLAIIAGWPSIESIDLSHTKITDDGVKHLAHSRTLRRFAASETQLGDVGFAILADLPAIDSVYLSSTQITDDGVKHLARCRNLRNFAAAETKVGNAGLAILAELPSIESIDLGGTLVTDEGLACLEKPRSLKDLHLSGTRITDSAVRHLQKLRMLDELEIRGTRLSANGIAKLRYELPHCRIEDGK